MEEFAALRYPADRDSHNGSGLIFDELFLPLGQPDHLKGGASRPSFTSHDERPVLIGCR